MTVDDIKDQIESKLGLDFDDDYVMDLFNECLMDLVDVLRIETKAEANLTSDEITVGWPEDMFEPIMVKLDKSGILHQRNLDIDTKGYHIFGGELHFGDTLKPPDKATIWYYRYPEIIDDVNDEPDIPRRFRHALKYYFIAVYQQEDEELRLEEDYWSKYYRVRQEIDKHTLKQKGMHKRRIARTRSWR